MIFLMFIICSVLVLLLMLDFAAYEELETLEEEVKYGAPAPWRYYF